MFDKTMTRNMRMTMWKHALLLLMMTAGTINAWGQTEITSLSDITASDGNYIITADISGGSPGVATFSGTLTAQAKADGTYPVISNLSAPLFTTAENATISNLMFKSNAVNTSGSAGTICVTAKGTTSIYNCGILDGTVTGGSNGDVGGLVGALEGTARVVNCFSYANITAGKNKGGIVGNNKGTSKRGSITTMIMNCMFYGDIAEGNTISPIYGGTVIENTSTGLANYNYYRYRSSYSINKKITTYNCALAMEEKFINRFERYRLLLNSNKKLAAWYATGNANDTAKIAKWVLETADRTIATPKPYPILKVQGKYPSIINYDADHAPDSATVGRYKGGKVGTLTVTISGVGENSPADNGGSASITKSSLTLIRTDKDEDHFNFNYDKVQLPYYNDVGTGNYTKNRVVTGWEITGFTGGTEGTYNPNDTWGGYNFADRHCTNKDKYGTNGSNRIFSQGAYFDVPDGVTGITIKPHWATAAYVSDGSYDVVFSKDYKTVQAVEDMGTQYSNNTTISINGDNQKVYTTIGNARSSMTFASGATVYDYAVVLVGNVHQAADPTTNDTPYTIMSIDLNHDNEPDYSYIFGHDNRKAISPIRYDFLNIMGIAEAQMPKGASLFRNVSIFKPKGWFEITNTCIVNFSQFEYYNGSKTKAPLILLGGTYEQFVSTKDQTTKDVVNYIHVGSNAWFAKFGNGTHSDGTKFTQHIPISVTGGDYDEFYLSGTYQPNITNMEADNAECYVSGGRFGEMAGASLEAIYGNVTWDIDWADIKYFYGGGVNANNPITGDIIVNITRSHVERYCGGPKFGDMSTGMTVVTNATDCTFDKFFGAGFGGNSYNRVKYRDESNKEPKAYQNDYSNDRGKYYDGKTTNAPQNANFGKKGKGVATDFDYEFFVWSTGVTGARFFVQFASFSLAITNNVSSTLTGCTINEDFYGGGNLGKVNGTATSVLDGCTVYGNVFGGGFSAEIPKIPVRNIPAFVQDKEPSINKNIGMFEMGEIADSVEYEWMHVDDMPNNGAEGAKDGKVYTDQDLTTLGQVTTVDLTVKGNTYVQGKVVDGKNTGGVFGGGDMSAVIGNTVVLVETTNTEGRTISNVYGGGNNAPVGGNTTVTLKDGVIAGDVFGGGNNGKVSGSTVVNIKDGND